MTTANDLLTESFMIAGIDSPTTAQVSSALNSLNNSLGYIGGEFLNHAVVTESKTLTLGTASYTIGSSGNIDTVRPIKIENCYLRDANGLDSPVRCLSPKTYNEIEDKDASGKPTHLYFLPEYPLAKIIFNCAPDYAYEATFEFIKPITEFSTTSSSCTMPPEYKEFLIYNTAVKIAEKWDRILQKTVYEHTIETKEQIDLLRAINNPPAESNFPITQSTGVPKRNILSDALYGVY
ncbi:MAG: hypothetical protein LLG05_12585 [Porphyromonadaceae bacterium]|nr:hypothetical protein [Porphyromonadaceae bacterium]